MRTPTPPSPAEGEGPAPRLPTTFVPNTIGGRLGWGDKGAGVEVPLCLTPTLTFPVEGE
jgi:hypothetical protein